MGFNIATAAILLVLAIGGVAWLLAGDTPSTKAIGRPKQRQPACPPSLEAATTSRYRSMPGTPPSSGFG